MTTGTAKVGRFVLGLLALLGLFCGLCALFVLVVTAGVAWQEHVEAGWPEVIGRVDSCGMTQSSTGRRNRYYIDRRLSYRVGGEDFVTSVYSMQAPGPEVWQYPLNQIAPYEAWVDAHPPGTPVAVQYDPGNHKKAVLVNDVPNGRPRTRGNLKLLSCFAGLSAICLMIVRIARPRPLSFAAE